MTTLAATLVNWSAVWKIAVSALVGGAGGVVAFGLALLVLERAKATGSHVMRLAYQVAAGVCGVLCLVTVALGLYAITHKPQPTPAPTPVRAALAVEPHATN